MPRRRRKASAQATEKTSVNGVASAGAEVMAKCLTLFGDSASLSSFSWGIRMTLTLAHLSPLVALLAGILILIMPRLLNFIIAIYLIFVGLTGLWPSLRHLIH
jgi:hypothetical protein